MRLDRTLRECRARGQTALIVYVTAGFPHPEATGRLLDKLPAAGADVVELGMPFSDPLADGPTIQYASHRALQHPVRVAQVLQWVREARERGNEAPLLLLSYANPLLAHGLLEDPAPLAAAGLDGLIVPDVPSIEAAPLEARCRDADLHLIPFLAPTSTEQQFRRVAAGEGGFIYCVSVTGVTGARRTLPESTVQLLRRARAACRRPLAVGFGVSGPEQARRLANHADGVIVGSALIERLRSAADGGRDPVAAVAEFVGALRAALDHEGERGGEENAGG